MVEKITEEQLDAQLNGIAESDSTKGERYYSRKFRSAYMNVRKGLVAISKARATIGNKLAVEKAVVILENALADLE